MYNTKYVLLAALMVHLCAVGVCGVGISMTRLFDNPILSNASSVFDYNYNVAYMPIPPHGNNTTTRHCLAIRVQNAVDYKSSPYIVDPSAIAISCGSLDNAFGPVKASDVVISPADAGYQAHGVEDPRVVYVPERHMLVMHYSAVNTFSNGVLLTSRLALATCDLTRSPNADKWDLHGPIFSDAVVQWSKSGALLPMNSTFGYLFWGDTNIQVATTTDFIAYQHFDKRVLMSTRKDHFDSELIESGPPPVRLSNGNYLFLYNSARIVNRPNSKPGWNMEYNLGYVVLDGADPTKILERSSEPIFSPELAWEKCDDSTDVVGLTPDVIFVEGMRELGNDKFLVYYQGCDAFTSVALLKVSV